MESLVQLNIDLSILVKKFIAQRILYLLSTMCKNYYFIHGYDQLKQTCITKFHSNKWNLIKRKKICDLL